MDTFSWRGTYLSTGTTSPLPLQINRIWSTDVGLFKDDVSSS